MNAGAARQLAVRGVTTALGHPLVSRAIERVNASRGGVILAYHELPEATLRAQLEALAERYRYVALAELVERLRAGRSCTGLAAITWDDGYGPTVEAAARLALERGWPMTFYLPTRYLDSGEPYWYQELLPLLERSEPRFLTLDGVELRLGTPAGNAAAYAALNRRFREQRTFSQVEALLRRLRGALHGSEARPDWLETTPPIAWSRVRELARSELLAFEAHTENHLALCRLSDAEIAGEMERSCARIEQETGRRVEHFCYPFGGRAEIDDAARRQAERRFRSATTLWRGRCNSRSDPYLLPRVPLYDLDSARVALLKAATAR